MKRTWHTLVFWSIRSVHSSSLKCLWGQIISFFSDSKIHWCAWVALVCLTHTYTHLLCWMCWVILARVFLFHHPLGSGQYSCFHCYCHAAVTHSLAPFQALSTSPNLPPPPFPFFLSFFLCPHLKSSHGTVYCCSCLGGREGMKCCFTSGSVANFCRWSVHFFQYVTLHKSLKNENCDYLLTFLLFQTCMSFWKVECPGYFCLYKRLKGLLILQKKTKKSQTKVDAFYI